jgi:DNA-directed RNA polymerase specialized sigma24 family protein
MADESPGAALQAAAVQRALVAAQDQFLALMTPYRGAVIGFLRRYAIQNNHPPLTRDEWDDLLTEVEFKLWKSLCQREFQAKEVRGWIFRTARNEYVSRGRRKLTRKGEETIDVELVAEVHEGGDHGDVGIFLENISKVREFVKNLVDGRASTSGERWVALENLLVAINRVDQAMERDKP